MILIDLNVLIAAENPGDPNHLQMKRWWEAQLASGLPVLIAWITVIGFLRLSVSGVVMATPLSTTEAVERVDHWLNHENVAIASPSPRHWITFSEIVRQHQLKGSSLTDGHLAALALDHGWTVATLDLGFGRFKGLKWLNPAKAAS